MIALDKFDPPVLRVDVDTRIVTEVNLPAGRALEGPVADMARDELRVWATGRRLCGLEWDAQFAPKALARAAGAARVLGLDRVRRAARDAVAIGGAVAATEPRGDQVVALLGGVDPAALERLPEDWADGLLTLWRYWAAVTLTLGGDAVPAGAGAIGRTLPGGGAPDRDAAVPAPAQAAARRRGRRDSKVPAAKAG